jgi:hypothetical protein
VVGRTSLYTACHIGRLNMAYSERAKVLRRCKATRQDGQPCKAFALWGGDTCAGHTYKQRGKATGDERYTGMRTKAVACTCIAYAWPHRPGGGLCNWPDAPQWESTTPAGTHSFMRAFKKKYRALARRWGMV